MEQLSLSYFADIRELSDEEWIARMFPRVLNKKGEIAQKSCCKCGKLRDAFMHHQNHYCANCLYSRVVGSVVGGPGGCFGHNIW